MFTRLLLSSAALTALTCTMSTAQKWSTNANFSGLTTRVFAVGEYDGDLVAGGQAFWADGLNLDNLASFDGNRWRAIGGGARGLVRTMCTYGGDLVVAGEIGIVGGLGVGTLVNSIARWDGSQWHALGAGLTDWSGNRATVFAVAEFQGDLYAGGDFEQAGGQSISFLAKWNGTNWSAVGSGISGGQVWGLHATATHLYVGGSFDVAGGTTVNHVAAWDGSAWSALGSGIVGSYVQCLATYQGDLYVGGAFDAAGGSSAENVARWDGSRWHDVGGGIPDWDIGVAAITMRAFGGDLYVGGNFVQAGSANASRVARWNGSTWQGFGGIAGSDIATTAIALGEWDGHLVIGGEFSSASTDFSPATTVVSNSIVGFDGVDAWRQLGRGIGVERKIRAMVPWRNGWVAVGDFLYAGSRLATRVAFFDGTDWWPIGSINGAVYDALVFQDELYVTGTFTQIDGVPIATTARYDGTSWHALGSGAGGDAIAVFQGAIHTGGIGGVRRWNGSSWQSVGPTMFGNVNTMCVFAGELYIGGSLGLGGGSSANLYAWDGQTLRTVGGGVNDTVDSLHEAFGALWVGGEFTQVGGNSAERFAAWTGSGWLTFSPITTPGSTVLSIADLDGEIYVGGTFTGFLGFPAQGLMRLDLASGSWHPVGDGATGAVHALVADPVRHRLLLGGSFPRVGAGDGFTVRNTGIRAENFAVLDFRPDWSPIPATGVAGRSTPSLIGRSVTPVVPNDITTLRVVDAPPTSAGVIVLGFGRIDFPIFGGVFVPQINLAPAFTTTLHGEHSLEFPLPASGALPPGTPVAAQAWFLDPAAPFGLSATDGIETVLP
ncbi:MAG: hypothetical protein KDB80_09220 [Planctomycetes bacterium]|nr:hypothetical protein [Planctomycetota bacterium]